MNVWKPIALCAIGASVLIAFGSRVSSADDDSCQGQPNMAAALKSLKAAKGSLEKAEHNKGGWRKTALDNTNLAIGSTQQGCSAAK